MHTSAIKISKYKMPIIKKMSSTPRDNPTVPRMQAALLRCNVTLNLCIRNWNERGSAVTAVTRLKEGGCLLTKCTQSVLAVLNHSH